MIRSADKASAKVNWTAATAAPGATPVSGYSVEAIATTANAAGEKPGTLIRTGADRHQHHAGPGPGRDLRHRGPLHRRHRSERSVQHHRGHRHGRTEGHGHPDPDGDSGRRHGGGAHRRATSVTATSDNGQIFYTDDGTLAVFGDGPSTTAKLYTGPVAITKATNLSFAAFDTAGNIAKPAQDGWYAPDASPAGLLAAPANLKATDGQGKVTLVWDAVPTATGYQVAVYDSTGANKIATQPPANTGTSQIITLPTGTYQFAVATKNTAGNTGAESATKVTGKSTVATDTITITRPVWKTNDFRVVGSSSAPGGTVSVYTVDPVANPAAKPVTGMAAGR